MGLEEFVVLEMLMLWCGCYVKETWNIITRFTCVLLWLPYGIGQTIIFLPCCFFFFLLFLPRLISAVADWMSAIIPHMVWPKCEFRMQVWNVLHAARWKYRTQKNRHLGTIAQLCPAISSQLRHISTIAKKLVKQQYLLHMSLQCGEVRPINGWDRLTNLGHPCKFQLVSRLGSITAWHLVVGIGQTLQRWTEGATCVRQGDHHVGHWPTWVSE